ncbi:DNA replication protein DnaC [Roseimicrobium gellanilyticum]|uniref:DNA replication protein DnaC n=1 Tax=Roseimicrobium gellanilyticum TaxID=748857 RepID=A0A366HK96_9BACT|nr:ATP-binding protein [Roseimicrobium gellanilyticum]RBP42429.1 DNA replication protein DnaC [Roseimicrobium gellanilyticum]
MTLLTPEQQREAEAQAHRFPSHLTYLQVHQRLEAERNPPPPSPEKPKAIPIKCRECGTEMDEQDDVLRAICTNFICEACEKKAEEEKRLAWENRPLAPWPSLWPERAILDQENCSGEPLRLAKVINGLLSDGAMVGLIGDRGRGKTVMAARIAQWRRERREEPGIYVRAADVFSLIKGTWEKGRSSSRETEESLMNRFREAEFLVIDEIQERTLSEWENKILVNVLDHRYAGLLPTLIVGNLSTAELATNLGPSISDRMAQTGGVVECGWQSLRQPGTKVYTKEQRESIRWSHCPFTSTGGLGFRGREMQLHGGYHA